VEAKRLGIFLQFLVFMKISKVGCMRVFRRLTIIYFKNSDLTQQHSNSGDGKQKESENTRNNHN
jgi:hypothetical protein